MKNNNFYQKRIYLDLLKYYLLDMVPRNKAIKRFLKENFEDKNLQLQVLEGPFKGLLYPTSKSHGSAFTPKIIGTYEKEIEGVITNLLETEYDLVLDVGCAEGYYAVGFAKYGKSKKVIAYDISPNARELCHQMSEINDVTAMLEIRSIFDENEFESILKTYKGKKILIILDVEGFEIELVEFISRKSKKDSNISLLVEVHDIFNYKISSSLDTYLKKSKVAKFFSLDDFIRTVEYNPSSISKLNFLERFYLMWEGRPHQMKWYFVEDLN